MQLCTAKPLPSILLAPYMMKSMHAWVGRMHPHQQGSAVNQLNTASLPVIIDQERQGGFDFLSADSCKNAKRAFTEGLAPEIVINIQVSTNLQCIFVRLQPCMLAFRCTCILIDTFSCALHPICA